MDKTPAVNKNRKSNGECYKDQKEEKKLNDASFWEKERIRVNAYRSKKKENQSAAENTNQPEKEH